MTIGNLRVDAEYPDWEISSLNARTIYNGRLYQVESWLGTVELSVSTEDPETYIHYWNPVTTVVIINNEDELITDLKARLPELTLLEVL